MDSGAPHGSPPSSLETADLCLVLDTCALWLECKESQRPLLCLSRPHANKWSRRLAGAHEGPPVLPLKGREAECEECQRRENKSIQLLLLSHGSSFFSFVEICYESKNKKKARIGKRKEFICVTVLKNTNMHSVLLFEITVANGNM